MTDRIRLPNRRRVVRLELSTESDGGAAMRVYADVGFGADGKPREIFLRPRGGKSGSTLERLYDDIGVLISLLLQGTPKGGYAPGDLADRLGRLGDYPHIGAIETELGAPASVIGSVLEAAAKETK